MLAKPCRLPDLRPREDVGDRQETGLDTKVAIPGRMCTVDLTCERRTYLLDFIRSGEHSARQLNYALVLLVAEEGRRKTR